MNISFALTEPQILEGSKDVTRRLGWMRLKAGDLLWPVRKCMGLKPGEKVYRLRDTQLRVLSVRREPLLAMLAPAYGAIECQREGFPELTAVAFVAMFCKTHKGCTPESLVTRIEFAYEMPQLERTAA